MADDRSKRAAAECPQTYCDQDCTDRCLALLGEFAAQAVGQDCPICGKPEGTGMLFDAFPNGPGEGWPRATWEAFAVRYRCPVCAETEARR